MKEIGEQKNMTLAAIHTYGLEDDMSLSKIDHYNVHLKLYDKFFENNRRVTRNHKSKKRDNADKTPEKINNHDIGSYSHVRIGR
jgi:hypothetical protein